jgi:hypothetical protein
MKTLVLLALLTCSPAWAALPPLSEQDRAERATEIVEGTVLNIKRREIPVKAGTNWDYDLNFRVEKAVKGSLRSGLLIQVKLRQTGKRPEGWAGGQGQNEIPAEDQKVRFFLNRDQDRFKALEPNGWEAIP